MNRYDIALGKKPTEFKTSKRLCYKISGNVDEVSKFDSTVNIVDVNEYLWNSEQEEIIGENTSEQGHGGGWLSATPVEPLLQNFSRIDIISLLRSFYRNNPAVHNYISRLVSETMSRFLEINIAEISMEYFLYGDVFFFYPEDQYINGVILDINRISIEMNSLNPEDFTIRTRYLYLNPTTNQTENITNTIVHLSRQIPRRGAPFVSQSFGTSVIGIDSNFQPTVNYGNDYIRNDIEDFIAEFNRSPLARR